MPQKSVTINSKPQLIAYLSVKNSPQALDFYQKAFNAELKIVLTSPDGTIAHSELAIGTAYFGVSEQSDDWGNFTVDMLGGSPVKLGLEVEDVDAFCQTAAMHGATIKEAPQEQFYGAKTGRIIDPYGFEWIVSTTYEEMDQNTMQKVMDNWMLTQDSTDSANA